ncbi:MAG: penicillin-binding transpeptidase domain-containing protein [bacterium]|jgi:stage V sporulation protein D (sporulation-specific penicillin-binding protein)
MTPLLIRRRIVVLFILIALSTVSLGGRLFFIQILQSEAFQQQALSQRLRQVFIQPTRGTIYDRNKQELAFDISVDSIVANPVQLKNKEENAQALAEILGREQADILELFSRKSSFEFIERKVDQDIAQKVRELGLEGVYLVEETKRYYPEGVLAAHILGFAGIDNQGLEGIEVTYDEQLRGSEGRFLGETTAIGTEIPDGLKKYIPSRDGYNLILTIDKGIQYIVERQLDQIMQENQARAATIIVTNPKTGEVLALGNRPTYDPNNPLQAMDNWRNLAIWFNYEPGSTFKIVTAAAALEEGVVSENEGFFCNGSITVAGHSIGCASAHGSQSLADVIKYSCNVGFITIGQRLGTDKLYKYIDAFGFGDPTGIPLPGEAAGILLPKSQVGPVELANNSFGQGIAVTPLQMINMAGAIANGGVLLKPQIVREIRDHEDNLVEAFAPQVVRQVVSRETAEKLTSFLHLVVSEGTGSNADVVGYKLAGKTGTAQKIEAGRYVSDKHVASFLGFGPVEDPQLAVLVVIDEPKGAYYGGLVAAPVFSKVMEESLQYLGVPPTELQEEEEMEIFVEVPNVVNLPYPDAVVVLADKGLTVQPGEEDKIVFDQVPRAGAKVKEGTKVLLYFREEGEAPGSSMEGEVMVPNLYGMTIREVADTLSQLDLLLHPEGTGLAVEQNPEPLTVVPLNSVIEVKFASPSSH